MWTLRTQFNQPSANGFGRLEWNSVHVETQSQAESWWKTRTARMQKGSLAVMFDPDGTVIKVKFG